MDTTLQATVLRAVRYMETSLMLTLFSPEQGMVSALARGALRPKSPLRGCCELFTEGRFTLTGKNGHYVVTSCQMTEAHYSLRESIEALNCAVYFRDFCETVVTSGEENAALYTLLSQCLTTLCDQECDYRVVKTYYELNALALVGFSPALDACANCEKAPAFFSVTGGGMLCADCAKSYPDAVGFLPGALAYLKRLSRWEASSLHVLKVQNAIQEEIQRVWEPYIAYYLEKKFRFAPFMKKIDTFGEFSMRF